MPDSPSPKVHAHEVVGVLVDASVKLTIRGAPPFIGSAVKSALETKVAVTACGAFIVTPQAPDPEQSSDHSKNLNKLSGVTVMSTGVLYAYVAVPVSLTHESEPVLTLTVPVPTL